MRRAASAWTHHFHALQADAARIIASMRQPAFLMHVADALGDGAERVCAHFVHNGRLSFKQLVHIMAAESKEAAVADVEAQCADIVTELFTGRLLEQVGLWAHGHGRVCQACARTELMSGCPGEGPVCKQMNHGAFAGVHATSSHSVRSPRLPT